MGNLGFIIISIVLFAGILVTLGIVFWDDAQIPQNQTQIPPTNHSVTSELKAMPEQLPTTSSIEDKKTVAEANNKFAVNFYNNIKETEEGNIFYSPYSISTALAMTYEGAQGTTKEEMQEVFHYPETDTLRKGNAGTYNELNKKNKNYSLNTANALWAEQTYKFKDDYFNTIEQNYGGRVINLDFKTNYEQSRQTINTWVEEQTNNKIKDLLPQGSLNSLTRLVLTNAIYFKGKWENEFDPKDTLQEDFHTPTETTKVDMMHQTNNFGYAEFEGLQILEMNYAGDDLSMIILLPEEDLDTIYLTNENLENWKSYIRQQEVAVSIPKFKFDTKYTLNQHLADMGMPTAFNPEQADFSRMDGTKNLYLSTVIHQGFIEVNEEGTEAAAATAVAMAATTAMPTEPKMFTADRPFIFIIQEKNTGNILFMGKIENPNQ